MATFRWLVGMMFALALLSPATAQDEKGKKDKDQKEKKEKDDKGREEKDKDPKDDKDKKEEDKDCALSPDDLFKKWFKPGSDEEKLRKKVQEHFDKNHKNDYCHCFCDKKKCRKEIEKKQKEKDEEKRSWRDCPNERGGKGNNGVGNGNDGPPPGRARENDGGGTGRGNPGNRGGGRR